MKLTISKRELVPVLERCAAIAPVKSTMPILANTLLVFQLTCLRVVACDLDVSYATTVIYLNTDTDLIARALDVFTLPAKKLCECVKAIPVPDVEITIDAEKKTITISGGSVSFTLAQLDAVGFPELPEVQGGTFDLDAPALVKILESVTYAQSKNVQTYHLCSVHLKAETNLEDELFLTAAATDGHCLAVDSIPLPGEPDKLPRETFSRCELKVLAAGLSLVRYTRDQKKIELSEADPANGWTALELFPTFAAAERKLKELKEKGNIETGLDGKIVMSGWNQPGGLLKAGFEFYRVYGFHSYDTGHCIKVGSRNWSNLAKYKERAELRAAWNKLMSEDPKALEG